MTTLAELTQGNDRVFPTHARVERYYPAAAAEEARHLLTRCIERGEGPTLLIGAPGTGKSMLLQVLAHQFQASRPVACLTSAQLSTRRALLQSILFELGQPFRQRDEGELRLELIEYLKTSSEGSKGIVLLLDEAQALPARLLEELRVLGNLSNRGEPRVRMLLAGCQALDETFASPDTEAFNQRIVARCYLSPFNHHDTAQYVRGHIAAAGGQPDKVFTADALEAVYNASGGIARLINQICDRALLIAVAHNQKTINKDLVQGAWSDLQQLPTPWNLPDAPHATDNDENEQSAVVEFGPLSGDHSPEDDDHLEASPMQLEELHAAEFEDAMEEELVPPMVTARVYAPEDDTDETNDDSLFTETNVFETEPTPKTQPIENLTNELAEASETASPSPAANPFDEAFDDEEIVIDQFATLNSVIPAGSPQVSNQYETELSSLLDQVTRLDAMISADENAASGNALGGPHHTTDDDYPGIDDPRDTNLPPGANTTTEDITAEDTNAEESCLTDSFSIVRSIEADIKSLETKSEKPVESQKFTDEQFWASSAPVADAVEMGRPLVEGEEIEDTEVDLEDDAEILVIDDEGLPQGERANAFRADYRQLFLSLRRD